MKWTNLDTIVKGLLISRGYPIHYYMPFLYQASRAYEELSFDSLRNIKTLKIPINSYGAIPLPCDFMDWVKVGIPNGQFVRPLSSRQGINRLNSFDDGGNKVAYGEDTSTTIFDSIFFNGYQQYYNQNGEFTGRMFGVGSGNDSNTFRYVPEREEIQLHENIAATDVILQYISDGSDADNATMITPYAKSTIEGYIIWKMKEASRTYNMGERAEAKKQYEVQHQFLRGRLFGLTKDSIYSTLRKHTHGSIKG